MTDKFRRPGNFGSREKDESLTTRMLDDHSTIVYYLKKLGKVGKLTGWVPYEFYDSNKAERVQIFTNLLQQHEQTPFLKNLVTGDEAWLLFKNMKIKKVCVSSGVSSKGIPKGVHGKKAEGTEMELFAEK